MGLKNLRLEPFCFPASLLRCLVIRGEPLAWAWYAEVAGVAVVSTSIDVLKILRICSAVNQLGTKGECESSKRLTVREDAIRCVHLNPVSKGLCSDMIEYRWSSARAVLLDEQGEIEVDGSW